MISYEMKTLPLSILLDMPPARVQFDSSKTTIYSKARLEKLTQIMRTDAEALLTSPQSPITLTYDGHVKQGNHRLECTRLLLKSNEFPCDLDIEIPVLVDKVRLDNTELNTQVIVANRKGAADNEVNIIIHGQSQYSIKIVKPIFKVFNDLFVATRLMSKGNVAKLVLPLASSVLVGESEYLTAVEFYKMYKEDYCKDAVELLKIRVTDARPAKEMAERITPALKIFSDALVKHQPSIKALYKNNWTLYYCLVSFALTANPSNKNWDKIFKMLLKDAKDIIPLLQGRFLSDPEIGRAHV
jgi:hypothetical protein